MMSAKLGGTMPMYGRVMDEKETMTTKLVIDEHRSFV